jgi:hypothetical protein
LRRETTLMAMWSRISGVGRLSSAEGPGKASLKEGIGATGVGDKTAAVGSRWGGGGAHTGDAGLAATGASVVVLTAGIGSVVITVVIELGTSGRRQLGREQRHTQGEPSRR